MPRTKRVAADGRTKFQRYRREKAREGMKLLRVWVPTRRSRKEAERQAKVLRGRAEEKDAKGFIEAAFDWPEP